MTERDTNKVHDTSSSETSPLVFILDVDGVMTTGQFLYTDQGKAMKIFGADDNDGLSLLKDRIEIRFVTGDKKGFPISKKRIVDDMGFSLDIVSTIRRIDWIAERYDPERVIYMGDGIFDHYVMRHVGYSIAPANADINARTYANYVTQRAGGDRSVAEACLHIMERFFVPFDPDSLPNAQSKLSGEWTL
jgi:3-deoxy-D-manno-octulosonate 8-phosphate phosphatase (KDO 8-P phosphatase)